MQGGTRAVIQLTGSRTTMAATANVAINRRCDQLRMPCRPVPETPRIIAAIVSEMKLGWRENLVGVCAGFDNGGADSVRSLPRSVRSLPRLRVGQSHLE